MLRFAARAAPALTLTVLLTVLAISCADGRRVDDVVEGIVDGKDEQRFEFSHGQMGTLFKIVLYAADSSNASAAARAAFARIDTLNQRLSDYLVDSEVNRLSATSGDERWVSVSDDLWQVLSASQELASLTDGAFDATVGPLTVLWRWAMRRNQLPPMDRLAHAMKAVGYTGVSLDSTTRSVLLSKAGMRLDFGGIAKGYAVDAAYAVLAGYGVTRMLVDGGGDIRVGDAPPDEQGWRIEARLVRDGLLADETVTLVQTAVATSGSTYRYIESGGMRYSHILDPKTGMGLTEERIVTVVAPTCMEADGLASVLSVMGGEVGVEFATGMGVAARVLEARGETYLAWETGGFGRMEGDGRR